MAVMVTYDPLANWASAIVGSSVNCPFAIGHAASVAAADVNVVTIVTEVLAVLVVLRVKVDVDGHVPEVTASSIDIIDVLIPPSL